MKSRNWGIAGVCGLVGAMACSGSVVHGVGEVSAGHSNGGDSNSAGSKSDGGSAHHAGASNGGADDAGMGGSSDAGTGGSNEAGAPQGGTGGSLAGGPNDHAGTGPIVEPGGDGGGGPVDYPLTCPECTVIVPEEVRDVETTAQKVFWIDYGSYDSLHNYENNGHLRVRDLGGVAISTISDSLQGPVQLGLSQKFAYMIVAERPEVHKAVGMVRVPLAGGATQELQAAEAYAVNYDIDCFTAAPDYMYWTWLGAVYRAAEAGPTVVETVLPNRNVTRLFNDGSQLFFQDNDGTWSMPLAGGAATELSDNSSAGLRLFGDYLYGSDGTYLTRLPKAGGVWKRIVRLRLNSIAFDGDQYVAGAVGVDSDVSLMQRSLATPATQFVLASQYYQGLHSWSLSSIGVFIASSEGLLMTPLK